MTETKVDTLTITPVQEVNSTQPETALAVAGGNSFDYETRLALLTPEEKTKLLALTDKINPRDLATVQNYGSELNQVISDNGNTLLKSVRADNTAEAVELTNQLLAQLNLIDVDEINTNTPWKNFARRMPFLRRLVTTAQNVMIKYDTVAENVDKISKKIGMTKIVAYRDNSTLQGIFDKNASYIQEIRQLIMGLKLKIQETDKEIAAMRADATIEPIALSDMEAFRTSLEKRLTDMQTTEYILTQNLFQIRATQTNNTELANKSENIVNNVIPIWKNQLAIALIMNNQKASVEVHKRITETSNEILKRNAQNLKMNSINVAKANEETVVSLETLEKTTQDLIDTVTEVKQIHVDGEKQRKEIEKKLQEYTENLMKVIQNTSK